MASIPGGYMAPGRGPYALSHLEQLIEQSGCQTAPEFDRWQRSQPTSPKYTYIEISTAFWDREQRQLRGVGSALHEQSGVAGGPPQSAQRLTGAALEELVEKTERIQRKFHEQLEVDSGLTQAAWRLLSDSGGLGAAGGLPQSAPQCLTGAALEALIEKIVREIEISQCTTIKEFLAWQQEHKSELRQVDYAHISEAFSRRGRIGAVRRPPQPERCLTAAAFEALIEQTIREIETSECLTQRTFEAWQQEHKSEPVDCVVIHEAFSRWYERRGVKPSDLRSPYEKALLEYGEMLLRITDKFPGASAEGRGPG